MSGPLNYRADTLQNAVEDFVMSTNYFQFILLSRRKQITFDQTFKGLGFKTSVL